MPYTKRNVLSQIARIYDVNGYRSPVVLYLKHLLQELWLAKLEWDDPLPERLLKKWLNSLDQLPLLSRLMIPRSVLSTYTNLQLIGFSDASATGTCAVIYIRVVCSDGSSFGRLLQSKTKVSLLNSLTIPRLELCAALLLAKLVYLTTHLFRNGISVLCAFSQIR